MQFTGVIKEIFPTKSGTSKAGNEWKAVEFIVEEEGEEYPQSAKFQMFGEDKVEKFEKYNNVGDNVDVSFNLKTSEFKGKFYTSLDAWKIWSNKGKEVEVTDEDDLDLPF